MEEGEKGREALRREVRSLRKRMAELRGRMEERTSELSRANVDLREEIHERDRAAGELESSLISETIISAIASLFVGASDLDERIHAALEELGTLVGASRTALFLLREEGDVIEATHEWCDEGVAPKKENFKNLSAAVVARWMERLREGEMVYVGDPSALPSEAKPERVFMGRRDARSLLLFPLRIREELAGFLCFDDIVTGGDWSEGELLLLRISSDIIGNAVSRKRVEEERERLIRELREALAKIKALKGLLPICAWCKKIRDDDGYWHQVEVYIRDHSAADFSHGFCPECAKKFLDEDERQRQKNKTKDQPPNTPKRKRKSSHKGTKSQRREK